MKDLTLKLRLILSGICALVAFVSVLVVSVPFSISLVFAVIVFIGLMIITWKPFLEHIRQRDKRRTELRGIREEAYHEQTGREQAIHDQREKEDRKKRQWEQLRRDFGGRR